MIATVEVRTQVGRQNACATAVHLASGCTAVGIGPTAWSAEQKALARLYIELRKASIMEDNFDRTDRTEVLINPSPEQAAEAVSQGRMPFTAVTATLTEEPPPTLQEVVRAYIKQDPLPDRAAYDLVVLCDEVDRLEGLVR